MSTLKLAFIGFRHSHILGLYGFAKKHAEITVVAACEEHAATRDQLAREGRVTITHDRHLAMLDAVECDAVAIGDHYGRRGAIAIEAMRRGKHVIADKPICTRLSELATIERLSRTKRLRVGCQLDMRSDGKFLKARELILGGKIGEVQAIHVTGQHPLLLGKRPGWYFEKGKHGGTINDIAIHAFDFIPWLTGLRFDKIVAARTWNAMAKPFPYFRDAAQFMLQLNNGCGVMADVSYMMPDSQGYRMPQYWRVTLYGREGVLELGCNLPTLFLARNGESEPQVIEPAKPRPFDYLEAFLKEIKGVKRGLALTTPEVLQASRMALLVQSKAAE